MITPQTIALVKKHEGLRLTAYDDTDGLKTIGWGHLIKPNEDYSTITLEQAESLLTSDLSQAESDAKSLFDNFDDLCEARQAVLIDMSFNLGREKLSHFHDMIAAVNDSNWTGAAYSMRQSLWYGQVKDRGIEDWHMILTGEFLC